jgi:hypothetical protein
VIMLCLNLGDRHSEISIGIGRSRIGPGSFISHYCIISGFVPWLLDSLDTDIYCFAFPLNFAAMSAPLPKTSTIPDAICILLA